MVTSLCTVQSETIRTTVLATLSTSLRSGKSLRLNQSHSEPVTQPLFERAMSAYLDLSKRTSYLNPLNVLFVD